MTNCSTARHPTAFGPRQPMSLAYSGACGVPETTWQTILITPQIGGTSYGRLMPTLGYRGKSLALTLASLPPGLYPIATDAKPISAPFDLTPSFIGVVNPQIDLDQVFSSNFLGRDVEVTMNSSHGRYTKPTRSRRCKSAGR